MRAPAEPVAFPTPLHRRAADAIVEFAQGAAVEAAVLVNSCARGTARPESDLDVALLIDPALDASRRRSLEQAWKVWYDEGAVFRELERAGPFACVHLDLFDGGFRSEAWDDGGGPDGFEIEIGNRVAHGRALWQRAAAFAELRARWLPYYGDDLRRERLEMVRSSCRRNVERVRSAAARGLVFHAFDRLYHAFQELLQALFIARRVYPIAYDKWIREQVEEWLGLPELYARLPSLIALPRLEREELDARAGDVLALLDRFTQIDGLDRGDRP
jgi:hypothetical protein